MDGEKEVYGKVNNWMDEIVEVQMDGWTDGWMGTYLEGFKGRKKDGWRYLWMY